MPSIIILVGDKAAGVSLKAAYTLYSSRCAHPPKLCMSKKKYRSYPVNVTNETKMSCLQIDISASRGEHFATLRK